MTAWPGLPPGADPWEGVRGWSGPWGPLILALWVAFIAVAVWLVMRHAQAKGRTTHDQARQILAERYARGELDTEEFRERIDHLRR